MDDLEHKLSKPAMCWPVFNKGTSVVGWNVLDFVDWVDESKRASADPGDMPIISLPPIQRSAVWNAKQMLDLWDSLMRGLPIGMFYLVQQPAGLRDGVDVSTNETRKISAAGFDLLDGQQRLRALMVGVLGHTDEKRCLWVDLGAKTAQEKPCLYLTSKAQPFGYDAEGKKLSLDDRRNARKAIEPDPKMDGLGRSDGAGGWKRAYDVELFEITPGSPIRYRNGGPLEPRPPLPHKASKDRTFEFCKLLAAWRHRTPRDEGGGVAALRGVTGPMSGLNDGPLIALDAALCRIETAQIALLKIEPAKSHDQRRDLLSLFERIGRGGTSLTLEEQLYSIYKSYLPDIRNTVDEIHEKTGRVLAPTKIVATALRIASTRIQASNGVPNPTNFAEQMAADPRSKLHSELSDLFTPHVNASSGSESPLGQSFKTVKDLLSYRDGVGCFWLPDVLLTLLPAEVWQSLVYWSTIQPDVANQERCRQEMVRFSLFWHLCVWNNEKAAQTAFSHLREHGSKYTDFPGKELYRLLLGNEQSERFALALIPSGEFSCALRKPEDASWRTDHERFVADDKRNEIGSEWWWKGRKMLPWLQRDYVRTAFPGYVPLSDHEDDLPYDVDHICPQKDWGYDWREVDKRTDGINVGLKKNIRDGRDAVGNGIGNLRIVDSSINRHDQDTDISEKMPFAVADDVSAEDRLNMAKSAFSPDHSALWKRVSRRVDVGGRKWNEDRLKAFQSAVEHRAAWLYKRFYCDLGYAAWATTQSHDDTKQ